MQVLATHSLLPGKRCLIDRTRRRQHHAARFRAVIEFATFYQPIVAFKTTFSLRIELWRRRSPQAISYQPH
jgi:hypothetical protein